MINDVKTLKIYATPYGNDPILYSRVNSFMICKDLTLLKISSSKEKSNSYGKTKDFVNVQKEERAEEKGPNIFFFLFCF